MPQVLIPQLFLIYVFTVTKFSAATIPLEEIKYSFFYLHLLLQLTSSFIYSVSHLKSLQGNCDMA